jgi:hypothetical protein
MAGLRSSEEKSDKFFQGEISQNTLQTITVGRSDLLAGKPCENLRLQIVVLSKDALTGGGGGGGGGGLCTNVTPNFKKG